VIIFFTSFGRDCWRCLQESLCESGRRFVYPWQQMELQHCSCVCFPLHSLENISYPRSHGFLISNMFRKNYILCVSLYMYESVHSQKAASGCKCLWISLPWLNLTNCMACRPNHYLTAVPFQVPYIIHEFSVVLYYWTIKFVFPTVDIQVFLGSRGMECRCANTVQ
jgi:hypothetical protein